MAVTANSTVLVDPTQFTVFKDEVVVVNVKINDVTDLQGWEFQLYWDRTILNCTNAIVHTPVEWQNSTQDYGPGLESGYNATHARFFKAQAASYPASSFNGSLTIATFTFQALQPGTTALTLTDVKLGNSAAEPIDCVISDGSVDVYVGMYMRSDTLTINGLNAYALNATKSSTYLSYSQAADGSGASWG